MWNHDAGSGSKAVRAVALCALLLGAAADALVAQDTPGDPERLDVVIFVVDRHRTLDRPLVIVLNPSWARSDAVISVEADALDASLLERGIRAAERAISSEAFGASEDVLLSVSRLQGPTGEARPAVPSVVRERAQWAADHFVPLIEERRAGPTGLRGDPGPGMDVLGVTGFLASVSMTFLRSTPEESQ